MPALLLVAAAYIAGTLAAAVLGGPWWWAAAVAVALAAALRLREGPAAARLSEPHAPHALGAPSALVLIAAVALVAAGHARYAEVDARPSPNFANPEGEHDVVAVARADAPLSGAVAPADLPPALLAGAPCAGVAVAFARSKVFCWHRRRARERGIAPSLYNGRAPWACSSCSVSARSCS